LSPKGSVLNFTALDDGKKNVNFVNQDEIHLRQKVIDKY